MKIMKLPMKKILFLICLSQNSISTLDMTQWDTATIKIPSLKRKQKSAFQKMVELETEVLTNYSTFHTFAKLCFYNVCLILSRMLKIFLKYL